MVIDTMNLIIIPAPVAHAGPNDSICQNMTYTMAPGIAHADNAMSYFWTSNGTGTLINQNSLSPSYIPLTGESGSVMLVLHVQANAPCLNITDTMYLQINPVPVSNIRENTDTICGITGALYMILSDTAEYAQGITWVSTGDGTFNNIHVLHPEYNIGNNDSINGYVYLILRATNNCGTDTDSLRLIMYVPPTITASSNSPICEGETLLLNSQPSIIPPDATYNWVHSASVWTSDQQNASISNASPSNSGTYTVTMSNIPYGCPDANASIIVLVHPKPRTSPIFGRDTVCFDDLVNYEVNGFNNSTFNWNVQGGTLIPANTVNDSISIQWGNIEGTFLVSVVEQSEFGCYGDTVYTSILVEDPSKIRLFGPDSICSGTPIQLYATGGHSYLWMNGETNDSLNSIPLTSTMYSVTIYGCREVTLNHYVHTWPLPNSDFIYNPQYPIVEQTVYFDYIGQGGVNFEWLIDSVPFSHSEISTYAFNDTGLYNIMLITISDHGCVDTASHDILVRDYIHIWVPNAFTPDNGDDLNKVFKPITSFDPKYFEKYEFYIFDRWGSEVFHSFDYNEGWDGTYKGEKSPLDTYVWMLIYKVDEHISFDAEKVLRGKVTIIR